MLLRLTPLLLAGCFALLTPAAHAQASFSIGPRVGLNLATYHFAEKPDVGTYRYRAGLEAGVAGTVGVGHFALQAAALYSQKGYTFRTDVDVRDASNLPLSTGKLTHRERLHYLTLPLALAYTPRSDGQGLQVFAGPYLGVLLGGRYNTETVLQGSAYRTDAGTITPVHNEAPDYGVYTQRFDAGLHAGVGYRHQALLFQVGYSLGLRSEAIRSVNGFPVNDRDYYNRAFQASLTYLFGPKGQ